MPMSKHKDNKQSYVNLICRSGTRWILLTVGYTKTAFVKLRKSFVCTSSFWAALAAIFAAIAAFMSYSQLGISLLQQQLTLLNSVRPELILSSWQFSSDPNTGKILIGSIENIGVSSALNVHVSLTVTGDTTDNSPPKAWIVGDPISIVSTDTKLDVNYKGVFFWKHGTKVPNDRMIGLDLVITYWDINGNKHERLHYLIAQKSGQGIGGTEILAPGLYLVQRKASIYQGKNKLL